LRGKHGEAIEESFKVLHASGGVERRRAARLGGLPQVQPVEAAEFYARMCEKTFPYAYPRMAQIEV